MYAVIETGGKQYRVELGTELAVELLEAEPGSEISLDRILLVADGGEASIGHPVVTDGAVTARVVRHERGDKVIAFKYRPKARRRVKKGHRQEHTVLRITDVRFGARSAAEEASQATEAARTERQRLEEAAARQAAEDAAIAARLAAAREKAAEEAAPPKPSRRRGAADASAQTESTPAPAEAEAKPKRTRRATKAAPEAGDTGPAAPGEGDTGTAATEPGESTKED